MTRLRPGLVCAALAAAALAAPPALAQQDAALSAQAGEHWSLLEEHCFTCHNFEDWAGGVAFDVLSPETIAEDAETWEAAVRKLRGRLMPPPGEPRPDNARIDAFVGWMEASLDQAAAAHPHPGRVALHRLNRKEYANAVRDLLALALDPAELLPADDISDGFDNVANVLQVSPSFLDQYVAAARAVAVQAVGNPEPRAGSRSYVVPQDAEGKQTLHVDGLPLGTRGGMAVEHYFPADGEYVANVSDMIIGVYLLTLEFEHTFVLTLDGVPVYETTIGGEDDLRNADQFQTPVIDEINSRFKDIPFTATAGPHIVGATFVARSFAQSDARLQPLVPGNELDRVPRVYSVEIRGPFNPTGLSSTPSRDLIFSCAPRTESEEAPCADEILGRLARRAYRRPVGEEDLAVLRAFYEAGRARGGFEEGVRAGLTRILVSPDFLYRADTPPEDAAPGEAFALGDLALAERLSFFLWSSIPDEELLGLAIAGRLSDPAVRREQVLRMLADPRAENLAGNFAYQWLHLAKLDEVVPDPNIFPYASNHRDVVGPDGDIRDAFREEARLFVDSILRADESVVALLGARHTYLNEPLALHYGIGDVRGLRFRRVELADSTRWGLLGKGAVLMSTSYPNRTAPVLRGQWILENLMGTPPAAPPPGVEALKENIDGAAAQTVRDRMVQHRADPTCNACHGVLDPLGLALENFDAVGRWRDVDRFAQAAIDASGELPDGMALNGPDDVRAALLARPEQFVQTFTEKLMTFALGRTIEHEDMPAVRKIVRDAAAEDYRFTSILLGIVESDAFLMSTAPEEVQEAALQR
jgi:mono/diheme cytochrome c family protein